MNKSTTKYLVFNTDLIHIADVRIYQILLALDNLRTQYCSKLYLYSVKPEKKFSLNGYLKTDMD